MTFYKLEEAIKNNIFTTLDTGKVFYDEPLPLVRIQLSRFIKKGFISKIKKGVYCFNRDEVDQLELAALLYVPSYISLETALNYYSLIPDIPQMVTSITPTTTKKLKNDFGVFYYSKINSELFFGFRPINSGSAKAYFQMAVKEKAVLDYIYIRKLKTLTDLRLDTRQLNREKLLKYAKYFPQWVQKVKII